MSTSRGDLQREIALEQAHVDRVYENLAASTASARTLARSGAEIYKTDRDDYLREESGTALFERDAFALPHPFRVRPSFQAPDSAGPGQCRRKSLRWTADNAQ